MKNTSNLTKKAKSEKKVSRLNIEFIKSSPKLDQCPPPNIPEIAFIGRSNVGKSSLINALFNKRNLAKTSSMPGKTQLINHFFVDKKYYLVDLPGYGWARASKEKKRKWGAMITDYILNRENIYCLFVLLDSRLEPQPIDVDFINWLGVNHIPIALVYTKKDKKNTIQNNKIISSLNKALLENWEYLPDIFYTSSVNKQGCQELMSYINKLFEKTQ